MAEHYIDRNDALNDILAAAAYLAEGVTSADGHAEAMNAVVPIYLQRKEVDIAAELANTVDDPYSRDRLLSAVAHRCAEIDDRDYAHQLVDAIDDDGVRSNAFEKMALAFAAAGDTQAALEAAGELPHPEFVIGGIAAHMAAAGDIAGARSSLRSIDYLPAKVAGSLLTANVLLEKDNDTVVDILSEALKDAGESEHAEESIRAMCDIGNLFVEAKRNDLAIDAFQRAKDSAEELEGSYRDFFLVNSSLGFLFAGSEELADSTLDLLKDKTQMSSALLGFARDHWKKDRKEDALDSLEEAFDILRSQKDIETRDSRARNQLMTAIAVQFAGFGKTEKAIEAAETNADPEETLAAIPQIAAILVTQNEDELARQTVDVVDEPTAKLAGLIAISDSAHLRGDDEKAVTWLGDAICMIDDVPQIAAQSDTLAAISKRFYDLGREDQARQTAVRSLIITNRIKDETRQVASLCKLTDLYDPNGLTIGDEEKAQLFSLLSR